MAGVGGLGRRNKHPGCLSATNAEAGATSVSASQEAVKMTSVLTQSHLRPWPEPYRPTGHLKAGKAGPPPAPVNSVGALPPSGRSSFCCV